MISYYFCLLLDDETVGRLDEELDNIVVNNVPTPPFPPASATRSTPTPPNKRVLEQKEFDKKLKAGLYFLYIM